MRRLPVNLATHPFERRARLRRWANLGLGVLLLLTAAHVGIAARLASTPLPPPEDPRPAAETVDAWHDEVARLRLAAEPRRVREVVASVAVANDLIAHRTFPWGEVFALFEATLPDDVRLEAVQPAIMPDGVRINLIAASTTPGSLRYFVAALEARHEFERVYPQRQEAREGVHRISIQAWHRGLADERTAGGGGR